MPALTKMFSVNRKHITENTATLLDRERETNLLGLNVHTTQDPYNLHGWLIYLDESDVQHIKCVKYNRTGTIPEELLNLLMLAIENDANVLCLSERCRVLTYMPVFEWNGIIPKSRLPYPLKTTRMFTINDANIDDEGLDFLEAAATEAETYLLVYKMDTFGWFVSLGTPQEDTSRRLHIAEDNDVPEQLRQLLCELVDAGVEFLCVETDEPDYNLPGFEVFQ